MKTPIDHTWYERPEGISAHDSAGGVVARLEQGRVLVAFITERGGDVYVLPKGHVEPGETPEEAAIREIAEEAGLHRLRLLDELGVRERLDFKKTSWKRTHYFLFVTDETEGRPTDPHTVGEVAWFALETLPDLFWPEQCALLEEHRAVIDARVRATAP